MWLCSKLSSLFSFYALPSGGKSKDAVVHSMLNIFWMTFGDLTKQCVSVFSLDEVVQFFLKGLEFKILE